MILKRNKLVKIRENRAELMVEYALVIGIVVTALMSMQAYMQRGIQGVIKTTADNLAAPAMEYSQIKDSQLAGVWEKGLVQYNVETTPTVTAEKNIDLIERPAASSEHIRVTNIYKDATTTNGKWNVIYGLGEEQTFAASEKMKADKGVSSVEMQPQQGASLEANK